MHELDGRGSEIGDRVQGKYLVARHSWIRIWWKDQADMVSESSFGFVHTTEIVAQTKRATSPTATNNRLVSQLIPYCTLVFHPSPFLSVRFRTDDG